MTVQIRKNNLLSALHRQSDTPISAIVGSAEDCQLFVSQRIQRIVESIYDAVVGEPCWQGQLETAPVF